MPWRTATVLQASHFWNTGDAAVNEIEKQNMAITIITMVSMMQLLFKLAVRVRSGRAG